LLDIDAGSQPNAKKGVIKNVFSLGVVQIANYVFPFITVPIVSRIIGPDKLGVINFASAFMAYFTILINFGFDLSATRAIAAQRNNLEARTRIFNEVVSAKLLLFAVSVILFVGSLFVFPQLRDEKQVAIYSFLLCFSWVITPNWLYQGMQELSRIAIFNLVTKVLFTVVILFLVKQKEDYVWQPLAISVAQIIVGIFSFVFAIKRYKIKLGLSKLRPVFSLLWSERIIFFSMVVVNLYTTTNIVLLGFMQNNEQVGYYTAGWKLITIIQSLIAIPLSQALFPFIGTAFSQGREKGLKIVNQLFPIVTALTGFASMCLFLFGPLTIKIIYGDKFGPSVGVFRVLAFIPMIICWSNLLGIQTMINLKMDKIFFRITAAGAVISVLLNLVLVTRFGFIGTAWCWLLTEIFITSCLYIVLTRKGIKVIDFTYFTPGHFRKFLKPLILTVRQRVNK
jgi:O-antigen/teichoic acid export membrane protein